MAHPGKWTDNSIGRRSHAVPLSKISVRPSFQVHQDEDAAEKQAKAAADGQTFDSSSKKVRR